MNRISLIQALISHYELKSYLEIGVYQGYSFLPIKCRNKIAIDPELKITFRSKIKWMILNPCNLFARYYEMTSDRFFEKYQTGQIDIAFVDGLHTFEQSLKDILNCLNNLSSEGFIIVHDCLPPSTEAACESGSFRELGATKDKNWNFEWTGDVWRSILYMRSIPNLKVCVIDTDFGLGIIQIENSSFSHKFNKTLFNKILNIPYVSMEKIIKNELNVIAMDKFRLNYL